MWSATFWKQSIERAVKTFAQSVVALIGANTVNVLDADWKAVVAASVGGAVLSVLTSIASTKVKDSDSPSLI